MVQTVPQPNARVAGKKLEILAAASRVFRRAGLHAAGMREIAAESGMHVGNLYYYFRNRQELLAFCQEQTLTGLLELVRDTRRSPDPADVKLARLIEGHVVRLNEELPGSLAHLEVEALEEPRRTEILQRRDRYEREVRAMIEDGMRSGLFRQVDAGVAAKAILGALNWTVKWFQPTGGKSTRQISDEFAQLLVGGLLAPGRSPAGSPAAATGDEARSTPHE